MSGKCYSTDFHPFVREGLAVSNILRSMGYPAKDIYLWIHSVKLQVRILVNVDDKGFAVELGVAESELEATEIAADWAKASTAWNAGAILDWKTLVQNASINDKIDELEENITKAGYSLVGPEKMN